MTWIRLKKSYTHNGKKFPRGRIINFDTPFANEIVGNGTAEFFDGPRIPINLMKRSDKMTTDLFKPKI